MTGTGVDLRHSGLGCRADQGACIFVSRTTADTLVAIRAAAAVRDAHEIEVHAYVHTIRVSSEGRFGGQLRSQIASDAAKVRWKRKAMPNVAP